ncbi:hypothetical protein L53_01010 [Hyphomonas sp. L-53-1-40]|uniref:Pycsar system effector family protein n=1 Tax=Hyphomonas sp. L-53-1-40 TaxID=1207058 RepID=UPI000458D8DE|nr:Pycsar system effector family protein [Hyphomonas sp. L-53-1-40]KCZ65919.1 hypothetical protein L53_01010 [Hyphomonas sp. L-53-1-40]
MTSDRMNFLKELLARQFEVQKFAEAKNAALLAANLASLTIYLSILFADHVYSVFRVYAATSLFFFAVSIAFCVHSFLPKSRPNEVSADDNDGNGSLLFYEDLSGLSISKFSSILNESGSWSEGLSGLEKDYVEQIIINARITRRKMTLFKFGMYAFVLGFFSPIVGALFLLWNTISDHRFKNGASF